MSAWAPDRRSPQARWRRRGRTWQVASFFLRGRTGWERRSYDCDHGHARGRMGWDAILFPRQRRSLGIQERVGDRRDLIGLAPRLFQLGELALERATLGLFVRGHLQREAIDERHVEECRAGLAADSAMAPERAAGQPEREALDVRRSNRERLGGLCPSF